MTSVEFHGATEDDIIARIEGGESINQVAISLGVNRSNLCRWLDNDPQRSARAKNARIASARAYDEKAEQGLIDAADPFELAKAKELAHHLRWRSSKIAPREYGDKLALGGADDLPPIKTATDEQLIARIRALQAKLDGADKG